MEYRSFWIGYYTCLILFVILFIGLNYAKKKPEREPIAAPASVPIEKETSNAASENA